MPRGGNDLAVAKGSYPSIFAFLPDSTDLDFNRLSRKRKLYGLI